MQKFEIGELVKHKWFPEIASVEDYDEKSGIYRIKFPTDQKPMVVPETLIRPITFFEFMWYRDPRTKKTKIGKNRAFPVLFSLSGAFISILLSFTVDGPWALLPFLLGVSIITAHYIGLRYNYTGRWV
jgi:hypothetical protein